MKQQNDKFKNEENEALIFRFPKNILITFVVSFVLGVALVTFSNYDIMFLWGSDDGYDIHRQMVIESFISTISLLVIPSTLTVALGTYMLHHRFTAKSVYLPIFFSIFVFNLTFYILESIFGRTDGMQGLVAIVGSQFFMIVSSVYAIFLYQKMK
jgi:hypothetical protein